MIIIYILSELIMALLTLILIPISGVEFSKINPLRTIFSLIFITAASVCFYYAFYFSSIAVQSLALTFNFIKFIISAVIVYKKISVKIICITLIIHSLCSIIVAGISFFLPIRQNNAISYASELLLLAVRVILFLCIVITLKRKKGLYFIRNTFKMLPNYVYILVLINLFAADGLIEAANYDFSDIQIKETIVKILAAFLSICVIVTLATLLINVASKKYFSDINRLLEKQIQSQISFYESREETYAEIRRFRHDYINHINCVRSMLKVGRYNEISDYLGCLTDMLPSGKMLFNTGNFISDAILSDKQNSTKKENITIKFEGIIPSDEINETDLCIILGNALDNAIEACQELGGEKTISVYGGFFHSYFILTVTNPTNNTFGKNNFIPLTTKADKSEHGFGLINIKSVVDKYDGYMKIDCNDNCFTLSLTFNSITPESVKITP